jgi:hypothetical protein
MDATPLARNCGWLLCAATVVALAGLSRAGAAETETRKYNTYIDDKPAGEYKMTIQGQDDGSISMTGEANVALKHLLVTVYKYTYRGKEVWKDGRLQSFASSTEENGKKYEVSAVAGANGLSVTVNGKPRVSRPDLWVTTYWRLPDAKLRGQPLALLDGDTGKDMTGTLRYVDMQQLTVCGQPQNYAHYRLTGDVVVDFWYDGSDRLVRQEWIEDKHKAVLELVSLTRP